jgi:hypothetical protein
VTEALVSLSRQAETAGHLWSMSEQLNDTIETMRMREAELRKALDRHNAKLLHEDSDG